MQTIPEFQKQLEQDLEKIIQELNLIAVHDSVTDDWTAVPDAQDLQSADSNLVSDGVEEWNARRALMPQLETRYRNINRALQKISAGTFGVCEICQGPIEPERLAVYPVARTDIAHSTNESQLPI